jgi:hypothetical protein
MIITTHQPIFLPWPGFFYKALCCNSIVLLDNVQFPLGRSWMSRNRLKSDKGELWLTVSVWKKGRGKQMVCDVEICDESDWRYKHLQSIRQQYASAPYLKDYLPELEAIYAHNYYRLVELNVALIQFLHKALGIQCQLVLQSDLGVTGKGTDLLISLSHALNANTYVALPPAKKYLNTDSFQTNGILLEFAHFHPPVYPQLWGDFRYNLSALDLLLNYGPKATDIITQSQKDLARPE